MGKKLYVGNLSYKTTNADLEGLFSQYGDVRSAEIVIDRSTGSSKGFGFVEMADDAAAQEAIRNLNDSTHDGRPLVVNERGRAKNVVHGAAAVVAAVVIAAAAVVAAVAAVVIAGAAAAAVVAADATSCRPEQVHRGASTGSHVTIPNMTPVELHALARRLVAGEFSADEFLRDVSAAATADLGATQLDLDRARRCGFPEVVFAEGKDVEALRSIFARLLMERLPVLATRVAHEKATALLADFPAARYNASARTLRIDLAEETESTRALVGHVAVVTAGTSDLPVAEEARETLDWMGVRATIVSDVGVAGPQRLQQRLGEIVVADAVVVVAGMEGALPSVVGGYVPCPVIAVPTSVGYGASFGGVAALLTMLNSCAANVVVVNIDAGFKAGYVAGMIARRRHSP